MSSVLVVGAETLTIPASGATDANAQRYTSIRDYMRYELQTLFSTNFLTALACASDSSLLSMFDGTGPSIVPVSPSVITRITPNTTTPTASGITSLVPSLIIHVNGGVAPDANMLSTIETLRVSGVANGILWREINDIPTPSIALPSFSLHAVTFAAALVPINGRVTGYSVLPSLEASIDGAAFSAVTLSSGGTFTISVPQILGATRTITVRDSTITAVSATTSINFSG